MGEHLQAGRHQADRHYPGMMRGRAGQADAVADHDDPGVLDARVGDDPVEPRLDGGEDDPDERGDAADDRTAAASQIGGRPRMPRKRQRP